MVRGVPCFLDLEGPLTLEESLTPVDPWEELLLTVTSDEGELVRVDL